MSNRLGFAAVYALLAAVLAASVAVSAHYWRAPIRDVHKTVAACSGNPGLERCLREQFGAQGAPDPSVTCGTPTEFPGHVEYLCHMDAGAGTGCYDVVASRSKRDGYPVVSAVAQKASCP